ncbi:MAG: riboflavin synthase [Candidatus Eremiobacteraeota bacterium]|nr:riboflavin synthase [Candidatus Eremiobacteraeota bacterium]
MFCGLIAEQAAVKSVDRLKSGGVRLQLALRSGVTAREKVEPKDSIAINGVCLTVSAIDGDRLEFDVVPETLNRSTLGDLQADELVNLELSLRLGDRIGGHFVYGHVDATGAILQRTKEGQGERVRIGVPAPLANLVCEKAFVAVDGVSVTVACVGPGYFEIALIPETIGRTTLGTRSVDDRVNLEVDPLARYAAAAVAALQ